MKSVARRIDAVRLADVHAVGSTAACPRGGECPPDTFATDLKRRAGAVGDAAASVDAPANPWLLAMRLRTLPLSVAPVLVGASLAWHDAHRIAWLLLLLTLLAAAAIQVGTNLYNDASDAERGVDRRTSRRGPPRAVAMGWLGAREVKRGALLAFAVAVAAGVVLVAAGGWPILLIGILGVAAGVGYSAGPRPLSATPFGEVAVVVFFGVAAVGGAYLLQTGTLTAPAMVLGLMQGALAAAVLHLNNTRDAEGDREAGRRTLAIVLGPSRSVLLFEALLAAPFALAGILAVTTDLRTWLAFLAIPEAMYLAYAFRRAATAADYNRLLGRTVVLELLVTALLTISLL